MFFKAKLYKMIVLALLLCLGPGVFNCKEDNLTVPVAQKGLLDLSGWDFAGNGSVPLNGEWEFYWQEFIPHNEKREMKSFASIPGLWSGPKFSKGLYPSRGYCTYRLTVHLPKAGRIYGLQIPMIFTAYKLYVNDRLLVSSGKTGKDNISSLPGGLPAVKSFFAGKKTIFLTLHISNFHKNSGGIFWPLYLGFGDQVDATKRNRAMFEMFFFGSIFMIGLYFLGVFFLRKKERVPLFFGVLCIIVSVRILCIGEFYTLMSFPAISWELTEKISFLTFYGGVLLGNHFFSELFYRDYSEKIKNIYTIVGTIFSAFVLVSPSYYFSFSLLPFEILTVFLVLYILYVSIKTIRKKREGAAVIFIGIIVLGMSMIIDMLYISGVTKSGNIVHIGLFIFILLTALVITKKYLSAFMMAEQQSENRARLFTEAVEMITALMLQSSSRLHERNIRVTGTAVMLAEKLNLPSRKVEDIKIATMLHDLGMIGLQHWLYEDRKALTGEQKKMLEMHPQKSVEVIRKLHEVHGIRKIIMQHHERYDGTGYPEGLKGNEIVLGARIIGLVDDFFTMINMREFQTGDKKEKMIQKLREEAGGLYDPLLVRAFIELIEEYNLIYDINDEDIVSTTEGDMTNIVFPSNIHFEAPVLKKIMSVIDGIVSFDSETKYMVEFGLGEVVRNAIIHGNKYDEDKIVAVKIELVKSPERDRLVITVTDQGEGMDMAEYNLFNDSRVKLQNIFRDLKEYKKTREDSSGDLSSIIYNMESFLVEHYTDFNTFRSFDEGEISGGIGLIHVMRTFDNVELKNVMDDYSILGMKVILTKYI